MPSFSKVIIVGHLTADPELRYLPSGTPVLDFTVAINNKYKDKEETVFADVKTFGKRAEVISSYLTKGDPILIEGKLSQDRWEDSNGTKKSKTYILAEQFAFIGKKKENNGQNLPEKSQSGQEENNFTEDDIPF